METTDNNTSTPEKSSCTRLAYILLALFLGTFGIHNFYAGRTKSGLIQIFTVILIGWLLVPLFAIWIWNLIEICTVTTDGKGLEFS